MAKNSYRAEIDNVKPEEWQGILDLFRDANLYQTWDYGAIRWGTRNLSHLVVRDDNQIIAAAQLRIINRPPLPGGIAYMRWGPLVHLWNSNLELEALNQVAHELYKEYVIKRRLCLRILPNAFVGSERASLAEKAFNNRFRICSGILPVERTFLLDLSPRLEELRKLLDQKWRNQLNRAERNGLHIRVGSKSADFELFTHLYWEMFNRKGFETNVDINEFARLFEKLQTQSKLRVLLCYAGNDIVSGIVCSALGDTGIYTLGATSNTGMQSKGAYLLQWEMVRWLKENGFRYYDLGGIDPERNPGVYHFKKGLSGNDVVRLPPFQSSESIYSDLYMKLADFILLHQLPYPLKRLRSALGNVPLPRRQSESLNK